MENISNYMAESILSIDASSSVVDAATYMHDNNVHSLLVTESGEYIGIVSDADFSWKVISAQLNPKTTKVSEVMSLPLIKIDLKTSMKEAAEIMADKGIHHLAIENMGQVAGILSITDFAKYFIKKFSD